MNAQISINFFHFFITSRSIPLKNDNFSNFIQSAIFNFKGIDKFINLEIAYIEHLFILLCSKPGK